MEIFHTILGVALYPLLAIGVIIVLVGTVEAAWRFVRLRFDGHDGHVHLILQTDLIRERLGAHLLLGLDFFIAADIIKSVVAPTWENVGILAAIVAIRIVLSYFLTREMEQSRRERSELEQDGGS